MKIICVVKFVPDVDHFNYDFEENRLIREGKRLIMNPDDASAAACSLKLKEKWPDVSVHIVTMGPMSIKPNIEDLIRMGADTGTILSDPDFAGSDTYATGKVISEYLKSQHYDYIFTGTSSLDGETSHVPAQIAEWLGLQQLSGITKLEQMSGDYQTVRVEVDNGEETFLYEMNAPAVLSFSRESKYKLPFIRKENLYRDVSGQMYLLGRKELLLEKNETGLEGSLTRVVETYVRNYQKKDSLIVQADEAGVDLVYRYLKEKGILP